MNAKMQSKFAYGQRYVIYQDEPGETYLRYIAYCAAHRAEGEKENETKETEV